MSDELPPLPDSARSLLARLEAPEPPEGAEARVFQKLAVSIAAGAAAATAGAVIGTSSTTAGAAGTTAAGTGTATAAAAGIGAKLVVVIAVGSVAAGLAGGTMLGRTVLAPEPIVVEKVRTIEKVVEVPAPAAPTPAPAPPPEPVKKRDVDTALARERELVDAARSALLKGDAAAALAALETHGKQFARGRLAEERESLWVQALVRAGRVPDARARAADFHRKYPKSLLGPTVDAALPP